MVNVINPFKKSFNPNGNVELAEMLLLKSNGCDSIVAPSEAYRLYTLNSDLALAVSIIAPEVANLKPIVLDDKDKVVESVHPYIKTFFEQPNPIDTYQEFCENAVANYMLHSNSFPYVDGIPTQAPKAIYNLPNDKLSISEGADSLNYTTTATGIYSFMTGRFSMSLSGDTPGRIIDDMNLSELYQIRGIYQPSNELLAPSTVTSIKRNLDVIDKSLVSLVSKLLGGLSANHILNVKTEDKQAFERVRSDIKNYKSGAGNNGSTIVAQGDSIDVKEIGHSNRDLQTLENKKDSKDSVMSRFKIPMAFFDGAVQSYNNYQTARYQLQDSEVIPIGNKFFRKYTKILRDRGILKPNQRVTFDQNAINALKLRQHEELKVLSEVGILTINEMRTIANKEAVIGGDDVFIDSNKIPVGTDRFTEDNLDKPRKKFYEKMEEVGYEKSEIDKYWHEQKEIIRGR